MISCTSYCTDGVLRNWPLSALLSVLTESAFPPRDARAGDAGAALSATAASASRLPVCLSLMWICDSLDAEMLYADMRSSGTSCGRSATPLAAFLDRTIGSIARQTANLNKRLGHLCVDRKIRELL